MTNSRRLRSLGQFRDHKLDTPSTPTNEGPKRTPGRRLGRRRPNPHIPPTETLRLRPHPPLREI